MKALNATASTPEVDTQSGWNAGTQNKIYAKESLANNQHLPEAIEALSVPGLSEIEAVKQDGIWPGFSLNRVRQEFDTCFKKHHAGYTDLFQAKREV